MHVYGKIIQNTQNAKAMPLGELGMISVLCQQGRLVDLSLSKCVSSRLETLRWVHMVQAWQLGKRQWSLWRKAKTCLPASSAWDKISRWQGSKLANLQMCHVNSHVIIIHDCLCSRLVNRSKLSISKCQSPRLRCAVTRQSPGQQKCFTLGQQASETLLPVISGIVSVGDRTGTLVHSTSTALLGYCSGLPQPPADILVGISKELVDAGMNHRSDSVYEHHDLILHPMASWHQVSGSNRANWNWVVMLFLEKLSFLLCWVLENFCGISEVSDVAKAKNGLAPVQNTFLIRTEMEL